jgi:hypothetical protein
VRIFVSRNPFYMFLKMIEGMNNKITFKIILIVCFKIHFLSQVGTPMKSFHPIMRPQNDKIHNFLISKLPHKLNFYMHIKNYAKLYYLNLNMLFKASHCHNSKKKFPLNVLWGMHKYISSNISGTSFKLFDLEYVRYQPK